MVLSPEQERVRTLLQDTITLLCRNGLSYQNEFDIKALIGITVDKENCFLIDIKDTIKNNANKDSDEENEDDVPQSPARKRKRNKRRRSSRGESDLESLASDSVPHTPVNNRVKAEEDEDSDDAIIIKDEPGYDNSNYGNNQDILGNLAQAQLFPATQESLQWDAGSPSFSIGSSQQQHHHQQSQHMNTSQNLGASTSTPSLQQQQQKSSAGRHRLNYGPPQFPGSASASQGPGIPNMGSSRHHPPPLRALDSSLNSSSLNSSGLLTDSAYAASSLAALVNSSLGGGTPTGLTSSPLTKATMSSMPSAPNTGSGKSPSGKNNRCPKCGTCFSQRSSLYVHLRMHDGQYRYSCPYCSKGHSATTNLKQHLKRHLGTATFSCIYCRLEFRTLKMLEGHLKICTQNDGSYNGALAGGAGPGGDDSNMEGGITGGAGNFGGTDGVTGVNYGPPDGVTGAKYTADGSIGGNYNAGGVAGAGNFSPEGFTSGNYSDTGFAGRADTEGMDVAGSSGNGQNKSKDGIPHNLANDDDNDDDEDDTDDDEEEELNTVLPHPTVQYE